MLLGVLSDTHGQLDMTRRAVQLLRERRAEFLIHCGDVGGAQVLELMVGTPGAYVWGNTDQDHYALRRDGEALGLQCFGAVGRLSFGERVVSFLHGDDVRLMHSIVTGQECDLLFHGHTHVRDMHDVGRVRIVNPGALQRASVRTVALVDSETREVEFIEVKI